MSNVSSKTGAKPNPFSSLAWGPMRGFMMVIASFLGGQLLGVGVVFLGIFCYQYFLGGLAEDWLDTTAGDFFLTFFVEAITLAILFLFLRKRHATLAMVGFSRRPKILDPAYAIIGWAAYFVSLVIVAGIASQVFNVDTNQRQDLGFESVVSHLDLVMAFISLVILPPIAEEVLFRGVLFGGLRKRLSFIWSAIITSAFFGALHLTGGEVGAGALWIAGIDTLLLSFVLCYLREYTGSIWASIGLHMIKNSVAYLYLFVLVS